MRSTFELFELDGLDRLDHHSQLISSSVHYCYLFKINSGSNKMHKDVNIWFTKNEITTM